MRRFGVGVWLQEPALSYPADLLALYRPTPHLPRMSDPVARLNAALEGRYRIESELGEGSVLTAWVAHDFIHVHQLNRLHRQYLTSELSDHSLDYAGPW